jgi:hypothetical protein
VAKRSAIGLKILSLAIKTEVIFYLSEKVIRAAVTIRRWQMKIFQSFLQAVGFGQTRVTKAIFQPLYDLSTWKEVKKTEKSGQKISL